MSEFVTTSRGDRVAFDHAGSGPALLFIAGAGPFRAIDSTTTSTAESAARRGISTIVYDRLGRGESIVDGRIDLERELSAVAALLDVAGGSAVLCGHSSGCAIALAAAAQGLSVDGLALWEAPIGPPGAGAGDWADEFERRLVAGDLEGAQLYYMKDMPAEFLTGVRESPMWPALVAQVGSNRPDAQSLAWAESAPLAQLLSGVKCPVEVLLGEQTFPVMTKAADLLVAGIPGSIQKRMPGANHTWEVEPMAAELVSFVSGLQ